MTATRTPAAHPFQRIDPQPDALPMRNQTDKTLARSAPGCNDERTGSHTATRGRLRETDVHRTG